MEYSLYQLDKFICAIGTFKDVKRKNHYLYVKRKDDNILEVVGKINAEDIEVFKEVLEKMFNNILIKE